MEIKSSNSDGLVQNLAEDQVVTAPTTQTSTTAPLTQTTTTTKSGCGCECCKPMPSEVIDPLVASLTQTLQAAQAPPDPLADLKALINERIDHRLFYQSYNLDPVVNAANMVQVAGGDLDLFMDTLNRVKGAGWDCSEFCKMTRQVAEKGDYDDLRRFFNVAKTVMATCDTPDMYYTICDKVLRESPDDFEGVIFGLQTALYHGVSDLDYGRALFKLNLYGFDGDCNAVDLNRIMIDIRNKYGNVATFFKVLNQSQDGRKVLDDYLKQNGMPDVRPDRGQFTQIQRMDYKEPMVIQEGENAALFCQAISSSEGLLPESCVFWSCEELGAFDQGWTCELNSLPPGTYHFVAKIGNWPGTDTAVRTVIVQPAGDHDNGHGNDTGNYDTSNPGQGNYTPPESFEPPTDFTQVMVKRERATGGAAAPAPNVAPVVQAAQSLMQELSAGTDLDVVVVKLKEEHDNVTQQFLNMLFNYRRTCSDDEARDRMLKDLESLVTAVTKAV